MISNINVGDVCFVDKASPASIAKYDYLKHKLPMLICPCNIKSTQQVRVTDDLGVYALIIFKDNPLKMSVILKKDLRKVEIIPDDRITKTYT